MDMRLELLFRFLEMRKELKEEQRKSALSHLKSEAMEIVFEKRRRRITQLGTLSNKICESIKREREEIGELQRQYCPQERFADLFEPEYEDSDEKESRVMEKLFDDDEEKGGVKVYVQNTRYKKIVLNVKDLTDICEVTTDHAAERELCCLDTEETKKKKKKRTKKLPKLQTKPDESPSSASQHNKRKGKKKQHNDSLSDDDNLYIAPPLPPPPPRAAPEQHHITLTVDDIDTLIQDFDTAHALKLRQGLEDLMRAQGIGVDDTSRGNTSSTAAGAADEGDGCRVAFTDFSDASHDVPSGFSSIADDELDATEETETKTSKKKKKNKKKLVDMPFDVNDVD